MLAVVGKRSVERRQWPTLCGSESLTARARRGRRNVTLNLKIVTADTVRLGVDGHICELQLNLRPFVELQVTWSERGWVGGWKGGREGGREEGREGRKRNGGREGGGGALPSLNVWPIVELQVVHPFPRPGAE